MAATPAFAGDGELTISYRRLPYLSHTRACAATRRAGWKLAGPRRSEGEADRGEEPDSLYIHTGDTIQGSVEVMYTKGQAIVDVMNLFKSDAFRAG